MRSLIALAFNDPHRAEEVRLEMIRADADYIVELEDAVVAIRKDNGKIKLRQMHNVTAGGALGGGFWGTLIGLIFLNPLFGAAIGAGTGAIVGALSDIGINDGFMKNLAERMPAGGSALFILVRDANRDRLLERLDVYEGRVLHTSLGHEDEARLREALHASAAD